MSKEVEVKVINALSEVLKDEITKSQISLDDKLKDLGLNSITFIKLVVILEAEFDFEFEDEELDFTKFVDVRDIIIYLEEKI